MNKFEISTDSTCDFFADEYKKYNVYVARLNFVMTQGKTTKECVDDFGNNAEYVAYYESLKNGWSAKTSILNLQAHIDLFTKMAKDGVLYALHITQSKGLSPTVENAQKAVMIVKESFPNINYLVVESGTTTVGEGMLVKLACKLRDEGKTNREVYDILEDVKLKIQHFIVVDDLMYLKRGGRISGPKATIGTILSIKPIIQFTREGKLDITSKEKGTRRALLKIVDEFKNFTKNIYFDIVIAHTNNLNLAKDLQSLIKKKYGIEPPIRMIGPIIGAHLGPGAVAYAFISNENRLVD